MFVRKFKPHELLVEMLNGAASLENSVAIPQIIKHRINIWLHNFISEYISKITESKDLNGYFYTYIPSGRIHSS